MFENLDDPRKQALLAMAAGLLSPVRARGWSGFGEAMGQGIQGGLLGYNQGARTQEAVRRGEMDRKLEQERLAQIQRANQAQEYMGQGIKQFFRPGVGAQPLTPNDDNGNPMPSPVPSFDQGGFANYLAQNPATAAEAIKFMPKPQGPISVKQGEVLLDPTTRQPLFRNDAPVKPKFVPGDIQTLKAGRFEITREMQPDGTWKQIGKSALDKPEGAPKPVYDPERGVFITHPNSGQGPVTIPVPNLPPKPTKPNEQYLKQQAGVKNVMSALDDYVNTLQGFGMSDLASPDARARMGTVYNNALLQAKEAYNLGVLNGPDYMILQSVLTDPVSWKGAVTSNKAMAAQAYRLKELMKKVGAGSAEAHGVNQGQQDPLGIRQ